MTRVRPPALTLQARGDLGAGDSGQRDRRRRCRGERRGDQGRYDHGSGLAPGLEHAGGHGVVRGSWRRAAGSRTRDRSDPPPPPRRRSWRRPGPASAARPLGIAMARRNTISPSSVHTLEMAHPDALIDQAQEFVHVRRAASLAATSGRSTGRVAGSPPRAARRTTAHSPSSPPTGRRRGRRPRCGRIPGSPRSSTRSTTSSGSKPMFAVFGL